MQTREVFEGSGRQFPGWRVRLSQGRGIPTPALDGDRVLVGGGFGSYDFFALDAGTGASLWHRRTKDDGPTAAVVSGGFAIYNTESCTLEAVDVRTGEPAWSHWLGDPLLAQPATDGHRVYMVYPSNGRHVLGSFHLGSGQPACRCEIDHDVITAPVVHSDRVYLSTFDGNVIAVDASTGETVWKKQMHATSAPWVYRGEVYVAHREADAPGEHGTAEGSPSGRRGRPHSGRAHERTSRFKTTDGRRTRAYARKSADYLDRNWGVDAKRAYFSADAAVGFGTAPASAKMDSVESLLGEHSVSRAWRFQGSRPVVVDGVLFDTTGNRLEARDAETDKLIWFWDNAQDRPGERRLTPPAVANGRIWAGTWDGRIVSWDAATGAVRWEAAVGAPCHWQPVVGGGRVYAGLEDGSLVSFNTGDDQDDGWSMWGGGPGHNG